MPPSHGSLGNIGAPNCTAQGKGAACTATVSYTPAANYFGPDSFTFTAGDGLTTSATATVSITVIQVNHPPTANAGGPYTGSVGMAVQFNGSGNDPDSNPITFSWTFGDGGTGSGPSPTYAYSASGMYAVTLTVTDSFGASGISQTTAGRRRGRNILKARSQTRRTGIFPRVQVLYNGDSGRSEVRRRHTNFVLDAGAYEAMCPVENSIAEPRCAIVGLDQLLSDQKVCPRAFRLVKLLNFYP